ncbi:hypothetical protein FQA39_LY07758 [Lamprigera yunnana]|nr:hypothetical protein FQA39_LY07758 [Lamprigera yunnana]
MSLRLPLVIILGATGSGKTKLSLELAKKFAGEIISADSMQIYKGLDIITAKATTDERKVAPHHMIDELHPDQPFSVIDFRNKSLQIIEDLLLKNALPIVVGGTNYYIESLLWKILVEDWKEATYTTKLIKDCELSSAELHKMLLERDPIRAKRLHPNDKRKILRSLEILELKGRKHSDILLEQQTSAGGSALGGGLRFTNSVVLWITCDQTVLDERLDTRVDLMLKQGLVEELLDFHKKYNEKRVQQDADYTKGIFQSIGFKEFHQYLMLAPDDRSTENGERLFKSAVDDLKRVTRRYAKKQKRWIINRFLDKNSDRQVPPVYELNATDLSKWEECVTDKAVSIVECFLNNSICQYAPKPQQETKAMPNSRAEQYFCNDCNRIFIGNHQWESHMKSHKHKRTLQRKRKNNAQ